MIVLGLDSAGAGCAAALVAGGRVLAARREVMAQGHGARLMPLVEEVMAEAGCRFQDIGLFGVTVGPGSFTGLRIGLAAVGGMALATGRLIVGVSSFAAALAAVPPVERAGAPVLIALDGRRAEPFVQLFDAGDAPLGPPLSAAAADLAALVPSGRVGLAGDGAALVLALLPRRHGLVRLGPEAIDPAIVARLAFEQRDRASPGPPPPVYIRAPDAIPAPPRRPGSP